MMIVSWNVRGINKVIKQKEVSYFLNKNHVSLIALIDHKVQQHFAAKIIQKMAR